MAVAVFLVLNGSAYAQMRDKGSKHDQSDEEKSKKTEQLKSAAELEKAYRVTMDKIPDKKGNNDPWGKIR